MMTLSVNLLARFVLISIVSLAHAQDLLAALDYGAFQGSYSPTYNLSYWRKIPFAAPPTGENRFRAPQTPIPITNGTYISDQSFDSCPQGTVNGSEDCGGSFTLPPPGYPVLNASAGNDFIFVYPNYRVNAFGFLPGSEISDDPMSDLNPGLLDQQAALIWTSKYISHFGGDPNNVTIWGQSAGAGSVVAQCIANDGNTNPRLFSKALASSPFWPKTYKYDAPEAQAIYDSLVNLTGCAGEGKGSLQLKCLKEVDVQRIREATLVISGVYTYNSSSYTWAPVIDGVFLTQSLSQATRKGMVNIDFGWGDMYNTHEGENFIPPGLGGTKKSGTPPFNSSIASFNSWLRGFLPRFSDRNIARVKELYPENESTEMIPSYDTSYARAGLIYRDVVLACPSYWIARAAHKKSYVGEYSIAPAKHASDTIYWNQVNAVQHTQTFIYDGFTAAFASFFQTGDPNAHKLTNSSVPGVPENWRTGEEFVVEANGFENLRVDMLNERCGFWREIADDVPI